MQTSPWSGLYERMLRAPSPAHLFERVRQEDRRFVLVTGCQRSGTTWMRKLLAQTLPGAAAPKELEVGKFLINGDPLDLPGASIVVLQTTFANSYPDCFARLPANVPVIMLLRNPYSVCRSLVYNWDSLSVEHAHRSGDPARLVSFPTDLDRWKAAISIYCQSAGAGQRIVRERPTATRLVVYDDFVHNVSDGLAQLADFLGCPPPTGVPGVPVDVSTLDKQHSLPPAFRQLVTENCVPLFDQLLAEARLSGTQLSVGSA
jgi:hypothetical protein